MHQIPHDNQGLYPVCQVMAVVRVAEWVARQAGETIELSIKQAYSETVGEGSGADAEDVLRTGILFGFIEDKHNPFEPYAPRDNWEKKWLEESKKHEHEQRWRITEKITVASKATKQEHHDRIRLFLKDMPLIATVNADDDWFKNKLPPEGKKWKRLHKIVLLGYDEPSGFYWVANSWNELSDGGGLVKMHKDYPFAFVTGIMGIEKLEKTIC